MFHAKLTEMKDKENTMNNKKNRTRFFPPVFFPLAAVFALFLSCEQPAGAGGGEDAGISASIADATDMLKIGVDADFPLNGRYTLGADITVSGWTPIGTSKKPFTGRLDGGGHTITITGGSGGVFGTIRGATVRNLKVKVTAEAACAPGTGAQVGGIAGNASRSTIDNCEAEVYLTVTAHAHNSSSGGIVGMMTDNTTVRYCSASGSVTLDSGMNEGLMVYAGGIAGYSGTGMVGTGVSGCLISASRWDGAVAASGGYPYVGGITGYNYAGAGVTLCSSSGEVSVSGANLPYAGGIAGYNSAGSGQDIATKVENCYSTAAVTAISTSKMALAGGVAGANACKNAVIAKCYARGAVSVTVAGNSEAGNGGSIGPLIAANAGGIAGAQYVGESPEIKNCAALNTSIAGTDSAAGAEWNIYRIAGEGASGENNGKWTENIAYSAMPVTRGGASYSADSDANGKDGADCPEKPPQSAYEALGWNFTAVWKMATDGYPALR